MLNICGYCRWIKGGISTLLLLLFYGCSSYGYYGDVSYFPPDSSSISSKFILSITANSHEDSSSLTTKIVFIYIRDHNNNTLLGREFRFIADKLDWIPFWDKDGNVEIYFFEYMDDVRKGGVKKIKIIPRNILSVKFMYDKNKKIFNEADVPPHVIEKISSNIKKNLSRHYHSIYFEIGEFEKDIDFILSSVRNITLRYNFTEIISETRHGWVAKYEASDLTITILFKEKKYNADKGNEIMVHFDGYGKKELSRKISTMINERLSTKFRSTKGGKGV